VAAELVREGEAIPGMANAVTPNPKRTALMASRRRREEFESVRERMLWF
jgi:hypothetical protein